MTQPTPDTRPIGATVTAAELRIGDVVSWQFLDGFDTAVVENIRHGTNRRVSTATLARPYALIGDAITTAGVGVTVGVEKTEVSLDSTLTFKLIRKSDVERHWRAVDAERKQFEAEIARLKAIAVERTTEVQELKTQLHLTESNLSMAKNSLDNAKEALRRERERAAEIVTTTRCYEAEVAEQIEARNDAEAQLATLRGRIAKALDESLLMEAK
jgi:chromosome segregation ATPase